jgi:hypothetical protein
MEVGRRGMDKGKGERMHTTITDAFASVVLFAGDTIVFEDVSHSRSISIEFDEFDDVYRVVIKHDPENRSLWYNFCFADEIRLDRFLEMKGFAGLKRKAYGEDENA